MKTPKSVFTCTECGHTTAKWYGKCPACGSSFGNKETLVWKEEVIELSGKDKTDVIRDYFYDAYRNSKPYHITSAQALEVMRVISEVKEGTTFEK